MKRLLAALLLAASAAAHAVVLTFDQPYDYSADDRMVYREAGFTLTSYFDPYLNPDGSPMGLFDGLSAWANGPSALASCMGFRGSCLLELKRDDGGLFTFGGFDASVHFLDYCMAPPGSVDLGVVSASGSRGGIGQPGAGAGSSLTFPCNVSRTFTPSSSDTPIDTLTFYATPHSFVTVDNIVLTPVPEPETHLLLLAGLAAVTAWRRIRRQ